MLITEARESGKQEEINEKMVEGRLRKFYEEVVRLKQIFVIDGENNIKKVLQHAATYIGG